VDPIQVQTHLDHRTGRDWTRYPEGELRRIVGLGVNVTDVYRDARCYLKRFFNAVEAFRHDRDHNGWRVKEGFEDPFEAELSVEHGLSAKEFASWLQIRLENWSYKM
jgi:hypothetical protein